MQDNIEMYPLHQTTHQVCGSQSTYDYCQDTPASAQCTFGEIQAGNHDDV